jgi:hypothetical protein
MTNEANMNLRNPFFLPLTLIMLTSAAFKVNAATNEERQFMYNKTMELLDTYCPDGARIVGLAEQHVPRDGGQDFTGIITEGTDERACLKAINTIVHEDYHGLDIFLSRVVLKEKMGRWSDVFYNYYYYYLNDNKYVIVRKTPTFPSKELISTIPDSLRTYRFSYIDAESLQTTQLNGIYGLFDEFNAYYQGSRASYDLLDYYEKKGTAVDWHDFFSSVNGTFYGCFEFKYYILKYLMFAKTQHPDVYRGIMANKNLIYAFLAVDKNVTDFISSYFEKKPAIFKQLEGYGWSVDETESYLFIKSNGRTERHMNFMEVYTLLQKN